LVQRLEQVSNIADPIAEGTAGQIQSITSRDILEPIQRQVVGEFGDDELSKYARSGNTAAPRTRGSRRGHDTIAAVRAGILGQYVDVQFKTGRDELQHAGFILADACLGLSTVRADLVGLGDVMLDADLGQLFVIWLA